MSINHPQRGLQEVYVAVEPLDIEYTSTSCSRFSNKRALVLLKCCLCHKHSSIGISSFSMSTSCYTTPVYFHQHFTILYYSSCVTFSQPTSNLHQFIINSIPKSFLSYSLHCHLPHLLLLTETSAMRELFTVTGALVPGPRDSQYTYTCASCNPSGIPSLVHLSKTWYDF